MATTTLEVESYTIPVKNGRPVILAGKLLGDRRFEAEKPRTSRGETTTVERRTRVFQAQNGMIAYLMEEQDGDDWCFVESAIWESRDAIKPELLWGAAKAIFRHLGWTDLTDERLDDGICNLALRRERGRDVFFTGETVAFADLRLKLRDPWPPYSPWPPRIDVPGFPWLHNQYAQARSVELYRQADGYILAWRDPELVLLRAANSVALYATLFWGDDANYAAEDAERYPEPPPDVTAFLLAAAERDETFRPLAFRVPDQPDPLQKEWSRRREMQQTEIARRRESVRQEEERRQREHQEIEAARQLEYEREEAHRREREAQLQAEADERRKNQPPPTPPEPTLAERMLVILQNAIDGKQVDASVVTAAAAIYMGEKFAEAQHGNWHEEY